jgi:hypothetical protein
MKLAGFEEKSYDIISNFDLLLMLFAAIPVAAVNLDHTQSDDARTDGHVLDRP